MRVLKACIIGLAILAVTANPVLAGFQPCCCSKQAERERACCKIAVTRPAEAALDSATCCQSRSSDASGATPVATGRCCCIKAAPILAKERPVEFYLEHSFSTVDSRPARDAAAVSLADALQRSPGRVSGPPLQVLYCVWLI